MFEIIPQNLALQKFAIRDEDSRFLHSDGSLYKGCSEWWPTRELAQAVLDKYQPPHVWEHGDVFRSAAGGWVGVYFHLARSGCLPMLFSLDGVKVLHDGDAMLICLARAKFLFNIREKL